MAYQKPVTVIKNDHNGREVWRYSGVLVEQASNGVVIEARFNREDMDLGYVRFRQGDRFIEYFYADRWMNIFEVRDVDDDHLKGWYCNFSRPAVISDGIVAADDLALDVFVYPDGRVLLLDEDEFSALPVTEQERRAVLAALDDVRDAVRERRPPFDNQTAP